MRVSVIRKSLLNPCNLLGAATITKGLGATDKSQWGLTFSRTPDFRDPKPSQPTKTLDRGFFFPVSTPWVHGGVGYKKLLMQARGRKASSLALRRAGSIWEVLEGVNLSLMKRGGQGGTPSSEVYSSSHSLNFYGAVKPYKRRKRRKALARPTPNGEFRKKKTKKVAGFKKALSLLPRRRRRVGSYRYLKSVRTRAFLWRVARPSRLRTPLAWSKKPVSLGNMGTRLGLKAGLSKLSPKVLSLSKSYKLTMGGLGTNGPRFRQLRAANKKNFRVPQARYKPGLSKAWRLLRLQFCLAWGLPWLRQRRFTNYVSQLNGVTGLNFLKMCASSVGFVVRASSLALPAPSFGDKAFVNGKYTYNPFFQVFKGDRVTVVRPPLPSTKRWGAFTDVISMPPVAGWEVDGLTRSTTVWAEPSLEELGSLALSKPLPFLTFRMYNWKYKH